MSKVLELIDIHKTIRGEQILRGVNLSVDEGEFLSIIGPSGSGKSSLLYIAGLLDRPDKGEIFIKGERIDFQNSEKLAYIRNTKFGFIFQFHYLINEFTVVENIIAPMIKMGKSKSEAIYKALILIEELGLKGKENRKPFQLSGGEQQRVAIARALINEPLLILADEPTGNLDSKNTEIVMDIFYSLNREGKTILMVTHDLELARRSRRIVRILDGRIID